MKYSIITVNYNNCEGLRHTIESVINQTFKSYEYIIIDGGSTDGSINVIKEYQQYISYWISEKDKGVYHAMNKGIHAATGEYINFMNSGDSFFDNNILSTVAHEINDEDIIVGKDYHFNPVKQKGFSSILPTRVSMVTFFMETLPHQGAFIKRRLFDKSPYDENLSICADWAFYVNKIIVESCRLKLIPINVSFREQGGISNIQTKKIKEERNSILHQLLPDGVYRDYETLAHLDRSTLYKLMNICENGKKRKLLTLAIKVINRLLL